MSRDMLCDIYIYLQDRDEGWCGVGRKHVGHDFYLPDLDKDDVAPLNIHY